MTNPVNKNKRRDRSNESIELPTLQYFLSTNASLLHSLKHKVRGVMERDPSKEERRDGRV